MGSVPRTTITLADAAPELGAAQARFQKVAYPASVDLVTRELLRILKWTAVALYVVPQPAPERCDRSRF